MLQLKINYFEDDRVVEIISIGELGLDSMRVFELFCEYLTKRKSVLKKKEVEKIMGCCDCSYSEAKLRLLEEKVFLELRTDGSVKIKDKSLFDKI